MDKMLVKIIKISLLLAVIIIAAIISLVTLVDPNEYKENISNIITKYTGRELKIAGKIQFSIFPNISLQLQDATLSNISNFAGNFVTVKNTKVKLKLLPLLRKRLSIKGFELDGIVINLEKDKNGNTNYADLLGVKGTTHNSKLQQHSPNSLPNKASNILSDNKNPTENHALNSENGAENDTKAQIILAAETTTTTTTTKNTNDLNNPNNLSNVEKNNVNKSSSPNDSNNTSNTNNTNHAQNVNDPNKTRDAFKMPSLEITELVIKNGTVSFNDQQNNNKFKLADFNMKAKDLDLQSSKNLPPIAMSGRIINLSNNTTQELEFDTSIILNPGNQYIKLNPLTIIVQGVKAKLSAEAKDITSNLEVTGNISIPQFSPNSLFKNRAANMNLPQTVQIQSNIAIKDDILSLNQIKAAIDNAHINGDFSADIKGKKATNFNITTENLNVERLGILLAAMTSDPSQSKKPKDDGLIPISVVKSINVTGKLQANNLYINNSIKLDQLNANIVGKNGIITAAPVVAKIAASEHNITTTLNVTTNTPNIDVTAKANDFRVEKLLSALGQKNSIAGNTTYSLDVKMQGNSVAAYKNSLSGVANLQINNGHIYGINLQKSLDTATSAAKQLYSLVKDDKNFNIESLITNNFDKFAVKSEDTSSDQTPFEKLNVNSKIQNGIIHSDFSMQHSNYAVNGSGSISLPQNNINYVAEAKLNAANTNKDDELDILLYKYPLEVTIAGPLEHPKITPNTKKFLSLVLKDRQQNLLKKFTDKVIQKVFGGKIGETLDDKLGIGGNDNANANTANPNQNQSQSTAPAASPNAPNNNSDSQNNPLKQIDKIFGDLLK